MSEATQSDAHVDAHTSAPRSWPRWQRFAFRYALLHYVLYAFPGPLGALLRTVTDGLALGGADVGRAPWSWLGTPLEWIDTGWQGITTRMAALGIAPYEVIYQPTGSGDTGAAYAQLLFIVVVSLAGALIWTWFTSVASSRTARGSSGSETMGSGSSSTMDTPPPNSRRNMGSASWGHTAGERRLSLGT